jgi:hypothetical protein
VRWSDCQLVAVIAGSSLLQPSYHNGRDTVPKTYQQYDTNPAIPRWLQTSLLLIAAILCVWLILLIEPWRIARCETICPCFNSHNQVHYTHTQVRWSGCCSTGASKLCPSSTTPRTVATYPTPATKLATKLSPGAAGDRLMDTLQKIPKPIKSPFWSILALGNHLECSLWTADRLFRSQTHPRHSMEPVLCAEFPKRLDLSSSFRPDALAPVVERRHSTSSLVRSWNMCFTLCPI